MNCVFDNCHQRSTVRAALNIFNELDVSSARKLKPPNPVTT